MQGTKVPRLVLVGHVAELRVFRGLVHAGVEGPVGLAGHVFEGLSRVHLSGDRGVQSLGVKCG